MVPQRVLDISKRSGDNNLGQTLIRLASLATAAHQYEWTIQIRDSATPQGPPNLENCDNLGVVHRPRTDAGLIRTEADR